MPKLRNMGLDPATEKQAIAFVQKHIELSGGGLDDWKIWRAARKHELCGQLELPKDVERRFKEMSSQLAQVEAVKLPADLYRRVTRTRRTLEGLFANMNTSFASPPMTWNEEVAARLIADAERGDPYADELLRELAAEYLKVDEKPPKPLAYYAATCLWAHSDRKKAQRSLKRCSDEYLARIVYAVSRIFGLAPTRNRATDDRDCACSIVATAIKKSESTVTKAWDKNKDFGRSSARDIVAEFLELEHDLDQNAVGKNFRAASAPIAVTELPNEENDRRKSQVKSGAAAPR